MDKQVKKWLGDILLSIDSIDIHLQGKRNFLLYKENITMRRSVERKLEIIGEATKRILDVPPNIAITNPKGVVNFRNRISHGYDSIEDITVWAIVINHIPLLKSEVESLLNKK